MMRIARRWCAVALVVCAWGCAQVLGLEDAKLDPGGARSAGSGPGGGGTALVRANTCYEEPTSGCSSCLHASCAGALSACVADASCWLELDTYAYCLGAACDHSQEECSFAIDPPALQACVQSCAVECAGRKLVGECELYCGCMAATCPDEDVGDCVAACKQRPAEVTGCLRDHCKMAANTAGEMRARHCQHASDRLHVCLDSTELPEADRFICTDGAESTWACNDDPDCCSESCVNGACE